jgi:hypothetical protein
VACGGFHPVISGSVVGQAVEAAVQRGQGLGGDPAPGERGPREDWPTGMTSGAGWDECGVALWKLTVHGVEVPGRFIVVDRESRPVR